MATLGNVPSEQVVLRLMARKSFALGLWIQDQLGRSLDIAASTLRLTMCKRSPHSATSADSTALLVDTTAVIVAPLEGFARFSLQASELNYPSGEYLFSITLIDGGYSSVIVQGTIELVANTESASVGQTYVADGIATSLRVLLREQTALKVQAGPSLPPGAATFTQDLENKFLQVYAGMLAEGQTLTADSIPDGATKVLMTVAERAQLANLSVTVNWTNVIGKPAFGNIITRNVSEFLQPAQVTAEDVVSGILHKNRIPAVTALNGISTGTAVPSGGADGDLYFRYTP